MADSEYTWREAEADAHYAAADDFAHSVAQGDCLDYGDDSAHEWADGCAWVIYTHRSRCLWMDSAEVRDAEQHLDDFHAPYGVDQHMDIDARMALCVYFALRSAYVEKWDELRERHEEHEDAEVIA